MSLLFVLLLVASALAVAFVLAPLFRDEHEPFDRQRPGTRSLHGPDADERRHRSTSVLDPHQDRCSNCGTAIEGEYRFCGECLQKRQ